MKKKFSFGKIAYESSTADNLVTVEAELKKINNIKLDVNLESKSDYWCFSASGNIWNMRRSDIVSGGQNLDEIKKYIKDPVFLEIHDLWEKYHLNDMNAGTDKQSAAIEEWKKENKYDYTKACEYLKSIGLYKDRGYSYGHSWLVKEIPDDDVKRIQELLK